MSMELIMLSNHLILCPHLLFLPSIFPRKGLFQWVSSLNQVAKVLELSIRFSSEYTGLVSFRIDSFHPLAVKGTLKSLFQHHSSKASILQCSAFFMVKLSHPYMAIGKMIALTVQTCASKVMPLLFNMLSRFVIAFLQISKHLLISWLQSTVWSDFGAQENKICHCFHFFPLYLSWSDGTGCHNLSFLNVEFEACLFILLFQYHQEASLLASFSVVKNLLATLETWVRLLGWEKSPGEENRNPLQYSCLEKPMHKGVWWAPVH